MVGGRERHAPRPHASRPGGRRPLHMEGRSPRHRTMAPRRSSPVGARLKEERKAPLLGPLRGACGGLRFACRSSWDWCGHPALRALYPAPKPSLRAVFPTGRGRTQTGWPHQSQEDRVRSGPLGPNLTLLRGGGEALTGHRSPRGARAPLAPPPRRTPSGREPPFTRYGEIISLTPQSPENRALFGESQTVDPSCHKRQERPSTREGLPSGLRPPVTGLPLVPSPPPVGLAPRAASA